MRNGNVLQPFPPYVERNGTAVLRHALLCLVMPAVFDSCQAGTPHLMAMSRYAGGVFLIQRLKRGLAVK